MLALIKEQCCLRLADSGPASWERDWGHTGRAAGWVQKQESAVGGGARACSRSSSPTGAGVGLASGPGRERASPEAAGSQGECGTGLCHAQAWTCPGSEKLGVFLVSQTLLPKTCLVQGDFRPRLRAHVRGLEDTGPCCLVEPLPVWRLCWGPPRSRLTSSTALRGQVTAHIWEKRKRLRSARAAARGHPPRSPAPRCLGGWQPFLSVFV